MVSISNSTGSALYVLYNDHAGRIEKRSNGLTSMRPMMP